MLTQQPLGDDVLKHWGLQRDPFAHELAAPEDIIDMPELRKAERQIMRAIDRAGWCAVTGQVGSGKTVLLQKIEARLATRRDIALVKPQAFEKQYLGARHICTAILEDLNIPYSAGGGLESLARRVGEALRGSLRDNRRVVLLIDEAHLLRIDALLALKRIYEVQDGFRKTLAIILLGQQWLARNLKGNLQLAEAAQRIDLYEIESLNGSTSLYLKHKLARAGADSTSAGSTSAGRKEIFAASAIKEITARADTPLALNNLAAAALMAGWDLGEDTITGDTIRSVYGGK